jgi:oligoendopeptidase F
MSRSIRRLIVLAAAAAAIATVAAAAGDDASTDTRYRWDLTDLYPSEAAWAAAKDAVSEGVPALTACRGHLADSAQRLLGCLDTYSDLDRKLTQVEIYASMNYDLDTRVGRAQQMQEQAHLARASFASASAWLRPEILAAGADKIRAYLASEKGLAIYRQPLEDILRRAPHTLDSEGERLVAQASVMAGAAQSIRDVFVNADFPYPEITLSSGEKVRLDAQAYTKYRASTDRDDRDAVFQAFWGRYNEYTNTLGSALNAEVQTHEFNRKVRKFDSALQAALFNDNVPTAVYTELIDDIHKNLPTLHRYLKLRRRMMGVETLGYEDLYAPIVKGYDRRFTPEEAKALVLEAVAPLGKDYVDVLRQGLSDHWIDWFPRKGKRSGAYSTTAYGIHPFQLQNFTGLYDEVSTLAHESGHSMHSYLADQAQPYPTHDYPIFIAEVASTLNENLLVHSMLEKAKNDDERLALLGSYLDGLRTTLFRQGMFAEFELEIHEMVQKGEPLNGENLDALYLKLLREYYGSDQGICEVKDTYRSEWAYIPHFYYNFYVYQYATSIVASISLADGIRTEAASRPPSTQRRDAYLNMLRTGSAKYAYDMLKDAGVDLATSAPFDAAMREMNSTIDAMEAILDKKK